jgi:hypothetical protein
MLWRQRSGRGASRSEPAKSNKTTMNEHQQHQFGNRVRHILNSGSLAPQLERRLQAARELALSRQRPERAPALAWADNLLGRSGGWTTGVVYTVLSLALLAGSAAGIYNWQLSQRIAELEEIDAQLLTDDLPIDAYLDRGFQNWLKKRTAEQ